MKRLLAIVLILVLTTSANAVFLQIDGTSTDSFQLNEGSGASISIISEDDSSWLGYLIVEEGGNGILSNVAILDAAGNLASANPYSEAGWGKGYELTAASTLVGEPVLATGEQFNFDFSGGISGDTILVSLFLDPQYSTPVDSIAISIVPEPVTIALFGFGALFLRSRK